MAKNEIKARKNQENTPEVTIEVQAPEVQESIETTPEEAPKKARKPRAKKKPKKLLLRTQTLSQTAVTPLNLCPRAFLRPSLKIPMAS